jgi:hypothetical protein
MTTPRRVAASLAVLACAAALGGCAVSLGSPFGARGAAPVRFHLMNAASGCSTALLGTAPEAARMGIRSSASYAPSDALQAQQAKATAFSASALRVQSAQRLARGGCAYF